MYLDYFGLRDYPFSITPDPAYLYLSPQHQEALAHLLYGAEENGGFVLLTGEVGTGKTTLLRALLEQPLDNIDVALCLNPQLTAVELIATVCDELHIDYPPGETSLKTLIDALNRHLLRTHALGRRTVVVIDEAQNLSRDVLEQVRLLTNLETHRHKLLHIMLVGQPELQRLLSQPDLRQLAQRITARYHLQPLAQSEIATYVQHRLRVAESDEPLFTATAIRLIYHYSRGVPRLINIICDRALLGAYAAGKPVVGARVLRQAAREVLALETQIAPLRARGISLAAATAILIGIVVTLRPTPSEQPAVTSPTVSEPPVPVLVLPPATNPVVAESSPDPVIDTTASPVVDPVPVVPSVNVPSANVPAEPPDLAARLAELPATDALPRLIWLWNPAIELDPAVDPCPALSAWQLRCLQGQGDWDTLRRFNRPVLLRLASRDGTTRDVLLSRLERDSAELELAGQIIRYPLATLEALWTREYRLLWRPPVTETLLHPGSQGAAVTWLRRQLALATQQPVSEPLSDVFDNALREQVKAFQQANALDVDGLVGAHTMLLLSNLSPNPDTPLLAPQPLELAPASRDRSADQGNRRPAPADKESA